MKVVGWLFKITGALALIALLCGTLAVAVVGHMLTIEDQPDKSDAIVVLGGSYFRPQYAADLYRERVAPEIWVVRPKPGPPNQALVDIGFTPPPQQELYYRILLRYGVSQNAIHLYGYNVASTAEEAQTFAKLNGQRLKSLLVVTSPYHVLRARLIFSQALPSTRVTVVASPYEPFASPWWSDQTSAVRVVNETAKLAWYLLGGRFMSGQNN